MVLVIAAPDGGTGQVVPWVGINTKLCPIRFLSQIEVTVARKLVEYDIRYDGLSESPVNVIVNP